MKSIRSILVILWLFHHPAVAQLRSPGDSLFGTYYQQRVTHFRSLPHSSGDIIFLGNSITDGAEWSELFQDPRIRNRGISGDISTGVLNRLSEVIQRKPAKVFLLIGTNDLARGVSADTLLRNLFRISDQIRQQTPATKLYVQSILPVNDSFGKFSGHTSKATLIRQVNAELKSSAARHQYAFIDLEKEFSDGKGRLQAQLTNDGLHLSGEGYLLWKHLLYPYVYDAQSLPSLVPLPQKVQWKGARFPLYACKTIVAQQEELQKEAVWLKKKLLTKGLDLTIQKRNAGDGPFILLRLAKVNAPSSGEAYHIQVDERKIVLTAPTPQGVFNGLQTLEQLMRDGVMVNGAEITDWPAFSWRGYMIDVGRNYVSMDLLKQQIDIMSRYKYNVFHFHFTEDIAWRLAIRQYPQLTLPQHMLRNKGMYYTEAEMKELIAYCRERYITLVPEIDMPGHSAAFTRAMGFDMQSDSGLQVVKNIIREFIQTYDLPYFHFGADEVKITNKTFVPEVTALVQSLGKKVIGWEPGGNFTEGTIRQLWMDDNGKIARNENIQYIDSRHLYLNHMDPLEAVVTIFNRRISNKEKGDHNALGATLCTWHDRAVAKEEDILKMNPVYPGMVAFAERCWQGGGYSGWVADIGLPGSDRAQSFAAFEERMLDHQRQYFKGLPFPYKKQSQIVWKLYGPYQNKGNTATVFAPERQGTILDETRAAFETVGGTIVLRHWWHPLIQGVITQPEDSTTWYAASRIWSAEETTRAFWIGFNNLSRSPATDSPPEGQWNEAGCSVWVNGQIIAPPLWKRGGQKGHAEIPLIDEGYEYRAPTPILIKKGWNNVLLKIPVKSFRGRDWQNPVKWMFTFVEPSS